MIVGVGVVRYRCILNYDYVYERGRELPIIAACLVHGNQTGFLF